MAKKKKNLTPAEVFARIRPVDESGKSGHTADGEAASQTIDTFDADSLTIKDTGKRSEEVFKLSKMVLPNEDQESTFNTSIVSSGLLQSFHGDTNVLFFAYGQTGSGKTHTMLGVTNSLSAPTPNDGWGLFPRVVYATFEQIAAWKAEGTHAILTVAAVEFYCNGAFDLDVHKNPKAKKLPPKNPVTVTTDARVLGASETILTSAADLAEYLPRVFGNRYTAATKMNDASSRSHCALILSLYKLDANDMHMKTTFSMIDLAGSERNSKTGAERVDGNAAYGEAMGMFKAGTPEKLSVGAQGFMINYELSFVQTEILKAGECHRKGMAYQAQKAMSTAGSIYMTACCDGRARLGMIVTLSPSPQHGFESWFTLKYAESLYKLKTPLVHQQAEKMNKVVKAAGAAAIAAQKDFAKQHEPKGPMQAANYMSKMGLVAATESTNKILAALANAKAASLKGLSFKRSMWDIVRRKKTPEQRAEQNVRIAAKWNDRFDVSKVDMGKVAASLEGITSTLNASISVASDLNEGAVAAAGKAIAKVGPQPDIVLNGQFADA
jgi:hypothetical protein